MRKQNLMSLVVVAAGLLVAGRALAGTLRTNGVALAPKAEQTTSYQTGDDGTFQKGVERPNPRFTIQADTNCVLDNMTGLIWARNANLGGTMTWPDAIVYCTNLNYGGQTDWRVPNRRELSSLIDASEHHPALPTNHPFTGVKNDYYWTDAGIWGGGKGNALVVYMYNGYVDCYNKEKDNYVWPMRGGR